MEKQNNFFGKSNQLNIIGLIGCALAVIGILLPALSVNVYITSVGISHFQLTALVIIPLLLIIGAAVLYVLKMDKLAMIAAAVAFVAYLLIVILCRSGSSTINIMGQEISLDDLLDEIGSGLNFGFGFYLSIIGYIVAIAGAFVNAKIFKPKANAYNPQLQSGPQGMPQNPYMAQNAQPKANPYMNQAPQNAQPQANPYMNQAPQNAQPQANPYMNQAPQNAQPQANPYMNQPMQNMQQMGQPAQPKASFSQQMQQAGAAVKKSLKKSDVNPYVQQAKQAAQGPVQQAQNMAGQAVQQAQNAANQAVQQANPYINQAAQQANPYLNQAAQQVQGQAGQAVQQAEQFVQNNIPNGENNQ